MDLSRKARAVWECGLGLDLATLTPRVYHSLSTNKNHPILKQGQRFFGMILGLVSAEDGVMSFPAAGTT